MQILKIKKKPVIFFIIGLVACLVAFVFYDKCYNIFYSKNVIETKDINHDITEVLSPPVVDDKPQLARKSEVSIKQPAKKASKTINISNAGSIPKKVLKLATTAYYNAAKKSLVKNHKLTIIDYSLPSNHKRLWVVDMDKKNVDLHTYVSHGLASGDRKIAKNFSNQPNSHKSSIGVMKTGGVYQGHNGTSLYLHGLEKNINDNVYKRHIVMHGANYVNESNAKILGSVGRSFGCPAIDYRLSKTVIKKIADGSIVFIYYPNQTWLNHSRFL